jgi:hypothetical protein
MYARHNQSINKSINQSTGQTPQQDFALHVDDVDQSLLETVR